MIYGVVGRGACSALITAGGLACSNGVEADRSVRIVVEGAPSSAAAPGAEFPGITLSFATGSGDPLADRRIIATGDGEVVASDSVTDLSGRIRIAWALPRDTVMADFPPRPFLGRPGRYRLEIRAPELDTLMAFVTEAAVFRASQIDASTDHACGVRDGQLWCWGSPLHWSPELPGKIMVASPVTLPAGVRAAEVRLHRDVTCIRDADSGLPWCIEFLAGPATFRPISSAPPLLDLVDAGARFCGRARADSVAWCWPVARGMLGSAAPIDTLRFTRLVGQNTGFFERFSGYACGLTAQGQAWCWGENRHGELGDGGDSPSANPILVNLPVPLTTLRAGSIGACGQTTSGLWCWGAYFGPGESRDPRPVPLDAPLVVPGAESLYLISPDGLTGWIRGRLYDPSPGLNQLTRLVDLVDELELCGLDAEGAVYCSWTLLNGGSETSFLSAAMIPVPIF